jgi:hypothetical protein
VPASRSSSGHQRSSAYGRIAWPQPIGDSQESAPSPTSPAARSPYDAPRTAPTSPYAPPVPSLTCIATAATPAKNRPTAASDAPSAIEPAAGVSAAIITTATAAAMSTCATAVTASAAVSGAARDTTPERTSSLRPLCSSPRVWRPTMNMLISAATTAPNAPHCHATSPPTVVTP